MEKIGASTIIALIIVIALIVFCILLWKEHWGEKMKEIQHWCIEKFMYAEHWADEDAMLEAMHDWTYWCPDANRECRSCPCCTQCRSRYGWYEIMMAKYCERSDPSVSSRVFIKELCKARRARWNDYSKH